MRRTDLDPLRAGYADILLSLGNSNASATLLRVVLVLISDLFPTFSSRWALSELVCFSRRSQAKRVFLVRDLVHQITRVTPEGKV